MTQSDGTHSDGKHTWINPPPCEGEQQVARSPQSEAPAQPSFVQRPGASDELRSAEHCRPGGHSPPPFVQLAPMPIEFALAVQAPPMPPSAAPPSASTIGSTQPNAPV